MTTILLAVAYVSGVKHPALPLREYLPRMNYEAATAGMARQRLPGMNRPPPAIPSLKADGATYDHLTRPNHPAQPGDLRAGRLCAFNPLLLPKERGDSFQSNSNPKKYAAQTKTTHPL
jgi:hypothetical protein